MPLRNSRRRRPVAPTKSAAIVGLWAVLCVLTGVALQAFAVEYRSAFGLGISVPDVWLVLTQEEVLSHADAFLGQADAEETSVLHSIPPEMRETVYNRIRDGELEIFYRREGHTGAFIDNINMMLQLAPLPENADQLASICEVLPTEFSKIFGRPISLDACEMRSAAGRTALYLQFDGAVRGTKTMQYQIAQAEGVSLVVTATASEPNWARMLGEFEAMVSSIRFD